MIRVATKDDFHDIVCMSAEFWQNTIYDDDFCYDSVYRMVSGCYDYNLLIVAEKEGELVGFVAGVEGKLLANHSVKIGAELAWWLNPSARGGSLGVKMLKAAEKQAKDNGIKYWSMMYMESSMPEQIRKIYEKMGYQLAETTYVKRL